MAAVPPWRTTARLVAAATLLLLVVLPLVELLTAAATDGRDAVRGLRRDGTLSAVVNTVWTGVVVAVLAVGGAGAAAWVTERSTVPGRRWLRVGMLLPLLVPTHVSALSWARAYGPAGLSDRFLGVAAPWLYGPAGVVSVITVGALPLAYAILAGALASRVEPDVERAARASGAGGWTAWRTVTLPLLRPAVAAAAAITFVTAVNAFGVPAVLGTPAGFVTVTTRIHADLVRSGDLVAFTRVLVLASGLVGLALVVVAATPLLRGAARVVRTGGPAGGAAPGPRRVLPALLLWTYLVAAVVVPLAALTLVAVSRAVGLPPTPDNWTAAHLAAALTGHAREALVNSTLLAAAASAGVVVLGGVLTATGRQRAGPGAGEATLLTLAVPGSALAVAILLAYGPRLRDTLALILIAYLAKFLAIGHRSIAAAVQGLPPDLMRAARTSGATAPRAVWSIAAPLLQPAIAAGALLVFVLALHELTISALLVGPGTRTLAVVVLDLNQLGDVLASSALAVVLTALTAVAAASALLLRRHATRVRP